MVHEPPGLRCSVPAAPTGRGPRTLHAHSGHVLRPGRRAGPRRGVRRPASEGTRGARGSPSVTKAKTAGAVSDGRAAEPGRGARVRRRARPCSSVCERVGAGTRRRAHALGRLPGRAEVAWAGWLRARPRHRPPSSPSAPGQLPPLSQGSQALLRVRHVWMFRRGPPFLSKGTPCQELDFRRFSTWGTSTVQGVWGCVRPSPDPPRASASPHLRVPGD